jgi:hypothetical protein
MISNLIIWSILVVMSYPISRYLMKKGMALDLSMPLNMGRYHALGFLFYIPLMNVLVMFIYMCIMLHKFERL